MPLMEKAVVPVDVSCLFSLLLGVCHLDSSGQPLLLQTCRNVAHAIPGSVFLSEKLPFKLILSWIDVLSFNFGGFGVADR